MGDMVGETVCDGVCVGVALGGTQADESDGAMARTTPNNVSAE